MKIQQFYFLILSISCLFFSCTPDEGCVDELACNYDADAEEDDGSCQIPLENPIYIVSYDANVSGVVGEEIESHVYIRNASCESIEIDATQSGAGVHPTIAQAKFCLGEISPGFHQETKKFHQV